MSGRGQKGEKSITFNELGEVHSAERGSTSLTRLPDQFYERAASYLKSLLVEMENCTSEGSKEPDDKYMRISEEYRRSKDILERVYSTRERKIVLAALNSSRGINRSTDEMIHEEEELYFSLKVELEDIRDRILRYDRMHKRPPVIRPETGINTSTDDFIENETEGEKPSGPTKAPMMDKTLADLEELSSEVRSDGEKAGKRSGPNLDLPPSDDVKQRGSTTGFDGWIVVRALKEVGPLVGPDNKTVKLAREDVATLPAQVAKILIDGGMVQVVEEGG